MDNDGRNSYSTEGEKKRRPGRFKRCDWVQKVRLPQKMVKGSEPKGTRAGKKPKARQAPKSSDSEASCLTDILDRKANGESVAALAAASGRNRATIFRYIRILTAPARSATGFLLLF